MSSYKAKCHVCGEVKTIIDKGTTAGAPVCEDCRRDLIEGVEGPEEPGIVTI